MSNFWRLSLTYHKSEDVSCNSRRFPCNFSFQLRLAWPCGRLGASFQAGLMGRGRYDWAWFARVSSSFSRGTPWDPFLFSVVFNNRLFSATKWPKAPTSWFHHDSRRPMMWPLLWTRTLNQDLLFWINGPVCFWGNTYRSYPRKQAHLDP